MTFYTVRPLDGLTWEYLYSAQLSALQHCIIVSVQARGPHYLQYVACALAKASDGLRPSLADAPRLDEGSRRNSIAM